MNKLLYILLFPFICLSQNYNDVTQVNRGGTEILSIQKGNVLVWEKPSSIDLTNLKAYYTMESTANDVYGTYNGTLTGGTWSASGHIGYAFSGDGNQDYIRTPSDAVFSRGNGTTDSPFSYDGWFKFNNNVQQGWLIDKRNTGTNNQDFDLQFYETALYFTIFSGGGTINFLKISYTWTPIVGQWYHIAITYDGSGATTGMELYVDGVSVGTKSTTGTYTAMQGNTGAVSIGAFSLQLTSTTRAFDGLIDNVKYWHEELTPEKVEAIRVKEASGQLITE